MKGPEKVSDWTCERAMVKITILKKPAAAPYKRPAANPEPEEPMSLEEKMELFQGQRLRTSTLSWAHLPGTREKRSGRNLKGPGAPPRTPKWRKFGILSAKAKTMTNARSSF